VFLLLGVLACTRLGFDAPTPHPVDAAVDAPVIPYPDLALDLARDVTRDVIPDVAPDSLVVATGPFDPPTAVTELNSSEFDDDPALPADMLEIYFNRSPDVTGIGDIWRSQRASVSDPWQSPSPVDELNSTEADGTPDITPDGLTIYFSSRRSGGPGSDDLYRSTRADRNSPWQPPVLIQELSTDQADTLIRTGLGQTIAVFTRTDTGLSLDGMELYSTSRPNAQSPWSTPQPITELNTAVGEGPGSLSADGLMLYFWSNRPGSAYADLYRTTRPALDQPFANIEAISELNTSGRDEDPWVSQDGKFIYFATEGDLYMASR
jgi:Tol biopolymer transport system component